MNFVAVYACCLVKLWFNLKHTLETVILQLSQLGYLVFHLFFTSVIFNYESWLFLAGDISIL